MNDHKLCASYVFMYTYQALPASINTRVDNENKSAERPSI